MRNKRAEACWLISCLVLNLRQEFTLYEEPSYYSADYLFHATPGVRLIFMSRAVPVRRHLASLVADFRRHGDQVAIVTRSGVRRNTFYYKDLADLSARVAAELAHQGIVRGDRVLLWGENSFEWIGVFFGCILRGVLPVPIDVAGSVDFAQRVLADVSPKLIAGNRNLLQQLKTQASKLEFENLLDALRQPPLYEPLADLSEDDPFQIIFTSGTTGEPKGIVHTHRNVLASLRPIEQEIQKYLRYEKYFHPLRFLHTLPLSHVFGQFMGLWIPPLLAAEVHFESHLTPSRIISEIKQERISALITVPRVMELLQSHLLSHAPDLRQRMESAKDASVWKKWWQFRGIHRLFGYKFWAFISGGATLPLAVEQFWNILGLAVIQGYGMTETAALISLNHPFRSSRGSLGKVLPGREVRLSEQGEIMVRGDTVSSLAWQSGSMSKRDSDWLATGDLAAMDETGNLRFKGRSKEVIVTSSGLNIYPEDLEATLQRQAGVRAATVIETTGPGGPEPLATLILQGSADAAAIVQAANRDLAEYQQIRRWAVWPEPEFPRTSTGKIMRREVARALKPSPQGERAVASVGVLAQLIAQITGEDTSALHDEALLSEDLHLDSLGRVALQSSLETHFGVEIDDATFQQIKTLGELKSLLSQASDRKPALQGVETATQPTAPAKEQHIYPRWPWRTPIQRTRSLFIELVLRPLVAFLAAPKIDSQLIALSKPVLLVSNHVTAFDAPLILYALPSSMRRRVAVAMSGEMLLNWRKRRGQENWLLFNWLAPVQYILVTSLFNAFPLPQRSGFRRSFQHAGDAMDHRYHVLVFPEGRRSPDGALLPFQSGAGLLWKELNVDLVPVYLQGLGELKTRKRRWFRSGAIKIRIGTPIAFPGGADPDTANRILRQAIEDLSEASESSHQSLAVDLSQKRSGRLS